VHPHERSELVIEKEHPITEENSQPTSRLIVMTSDQLNRNGSVIALSALANRAEEMWEHGAPMHLGHDVHQLLGWAFPMGIAFSHASGLLVGYHVLPKNDNERKELSRAHQGYYAALHIKQCKVHIPKLDKLLGGLRSNEAKYLYASCVAYIQAELAVSVFEEVFSQADSDGLIDLRMLMREFDVLGPGVFKHKKSDLAVFAHPFFRKSLSRLNSFNPDFLEDMQRLVPRVDLSIRIALDRDMVGLASTYQDHIELAYWRGPFFNDDLSRIPRGVTEYANPEGMGRWESGVFKTQFWWKDNEGARSFESEEIREVPSMGLPSEGYGLRYVHSYMGDEGNLIHHLDGAIRAYTTGDYEFRKNVSIDRAGKHSQYTKLFRLDGDITVSEWKHLVSNYYQGNILVVEYFGGLEEFNRGAGLVEEGIPPDISPRARMCPYSMARDSGVIVFVSFGQLFNDASSDLRSFAVRDYFVKDGSKDKYVEWIGLEWVKAIKRLGGVCELPSGIRLTNFEDEYFNVPTLRHRPGVDLPDVQLSAKGLQLLVRGLTGKGRDSVLGVSMAWPYNNAELSISAIGHATSVAKWLELTGGRWPGFGMQPADWIDWQKAEMAKVWSTRSGFPSIEEIGRTTGSLWIHRRPLGKEVEVESQVDEGKQGIRHKLMFPPEEDALLGAVESGLLGVATGYEVLAARCIKCGGDYMKCEHSKLLDDGVTVEISKCNPLGRFWTDRPTRWNRI
jgi:hypothetical protein